MSSNDREQVEQLTKNVWWSKQFPIECGLQSSGKTGILTLRIQFIDALDHEYRSSKVIFTRCININYLCVPLFYPLTDRMTFVILVVFILPTLQNTGAALPQLHGPP